MTVGQFAEIAVMAILGMFIGEFGFRRTIAIGAFAYFARYLSLGLNKLARTIGALGGRFRAIYLDHPFNNRNF